MEDLRPWTLRELPSSRVEIKNHPKSINYGLYSDINKIAPTWTKVSETPWYGRSMLLGGVGRRAMGTTISNDVPTFFTNHEANPKAQRCTASELRAKIKKELSEPNASAYVLPGGRNSLEKPLHGRYRTFVHGKCTLIEPLITERDKTAIQWEQPKDTIAEVCKEYGLYLPSGHLLSL